VFDRGTKAKARSSYRLLILDGHGSHASNDFIEYCYANKILLAIFPPHSTHSLQPLDVVVFSPLSAAYSQELVQHLHCTQGLIPVKKADFFLLFWPAYDVSFTSSNILKAFEATGVSPANAEVILKRFTSIPSREGEDPELAHHRDSSS
jgi:hypothetical protein